MKLEDTIELSVLPGPRLWGSLSPQLHIVWLQTHFETPTKQIIDVYLYDIEKGKLIFCHRLYRPIPQLSGFQNKIDPYRAHDRYI